MFHTSFILYYYQRAHFCRQHTSTNSNQNDIPTRAKSVLGLNCMIPYNYIDGTCHDVSFVEFESNTGLALVHVDTPTIMCTKILK